MTVYFVSAGIGGIEYLTVQAKDILTNAQVVLYDALVDKSLLDVVPIDCVLIPVGKRGGKKSTAQTQINDLLIEYGRKYDRVVRLKSGDIGVFGRINEELTAIKQTQIDYQLITGVSSALAVPLLNEILLTEKNDSRCFTILTGHTPDTLDWSALAKIDTLVILMGGRNLPIIVENLLRGGKTPELPVAIVKNGGRDNQEVWKGSLSSIVNMTRDISLSPCIIIIGKVASGFC